MAAEQPRSVPDSAGSVVGRLLPERPSSTANAFCRRASEHLKLVQPYSPGADASIKANREFTPGNPLTASQKNPVRMVVSVLEPANNRNTGITEQYCQEITVEYLSGAVTFGQVIG